MTKRAHARRERQHVGYNLTLDRTVYAIIRVQAARANVTPRRYLHDLVRAAALTSTAEGKQP